MAWRLVGNQGAEWVKETVRVMRGASDSRLWERAGFYWVNRPSTEVSVGSEARWVAMRLVMAGALTDFKLL